MSKFRVLQRLKKIKGFDECQRVEALVSLANELEIDENQWLSFELEKNTENLLIQLIRKKHQDYVTKLLVKIGFILILLSGFWSIMKSL